MEALLAIFIVKIPSIAGIGGLFAGLISRRFPVGLIIGALMGVLDSVVLEAVNVGTVSPASWTMAILAGVVMSAVGRLLKNVFFGKKSASS